PSFGEMDRPLFIEVEGNYKLKEYFPYIEKGGANELTVPLFIDMQTVGVLHVERDFGGDPFTHADSEALKMQANYFSSMLENVRLYEGEKQTKSRLKSLLNDHQDLIKETIEQDDFHGIIKKVGTMLKSGVLLFDRFMRMISNHQIDEQTDIEQIKTVVGEAVNSRRGGIWQKEVQLNGRKIIHIFQIRDRKSVV